MRSNTDAFEICCRAYYFSIQKDFTKRQKGNFLSRLGQLQFDLTTQETKQIMARTYTYCGNREHRIVGAGYIRNVGGRGLKFKQGSVATLI